MKNEERFNKLSENVELIVLIRSKILCGQKLVYNSFTIFGATENDARFIEAYLKNVDFPKRYAFLVQHQPSVVIDTQNKIKNNKELVNENELIIKFVLYSTYKKNKYETIIKKNPKIMDTVNKKVRKKKALDVEEQFVLDYTKDIQQAMAESIMLKS